MTALCGGGPSGPQSGVNGIVSISAAAIEIFISGIGFPEVAPILAPIIAGLIDIEITTYCSTDPPVDPGLTATIVEDALHIPPTTTTFSSQGKVAQWFESRYWYQICQCTSTTTPTPPALSNPGGAVSNPGLPSKATPCWNVTVPFSVPAIGVLPGNNYDLSPVALPPGATQLITLNVGPPLSQAQGVMLPAVMLNPKLTVTVNEAGGTGSFFVSWKAYLANGTASSNSTAQMSTFFGPGFAAGATQTQIRTTTDNTATYFIVYAQATDSVPHTGTVQVSMFCPPGVYVNQACCAPDPLIEALLQQVLQYEQAIYAALPVPLNSFAEGTVHSGLTGNGSITFSGVPVAVKVTLTTIPGWVGLEVGSPNFYFDVGWLTFATSEGSYAQQRLDLQEQLLTVPVLSGSAGYTLKNGIVATITELTPGP